MNRNTCVPLLYLFVINFQHAEKELQRNKDKFCSDTLQVHDDSNTSTRHLTLFGLQVFSNILKQPFTEFRNQAFVGSVAHH